MRKLGRLNGKLLQSFTKTVQTVHAEMIRRSLAKPARTDHMKRMMTIHKIHQPSTPIALWGAGVVLLVATLGAGLAASDVDAAAKSVATLQPFAQEHVILSGKEERAIARTVEAVCGGIIFREEDPDCFAGTAPEKNPVMAEPATGTPALPAQPSGS
ncbi:hypothetical protein [Stappia sp. TSB10GB4]|uniref:hypothetical protein n=1 Tax=Stappia sp. TSB10GB4 TaxID=2003584 RepID=UPI0016460069|nr:hypothetical protein [Stappia sp. TSB10GB4]